MSTTRSSLAHDELLALSLTNPDRLREITAREGRVILALDGLQPDAAAPLRIGFRGHLRKRESLSILIFRYHPLPRRYD